MQALFKVFNVISSHLYFYLFFEAHTYNDKKVTSSFLLMRLKDNIVISSQYLAIEIKEEEKNDDEKKIRKLLKIFFSCVHNNMCMLDLIIFHVFIVLLQRLWITLKILREKKCR